MGLLDKAKEKASHLAGQAKDKIGEVKERRKADDLLDDLGRIVFRQRSERGEPGDDAEIERIVGELRTLEAEGAEIVPPAAAGATEEPTTASAPETGTATAMPTPPMPTPPPVPADSGPVESPDPPAAV
jgi:hypothetical protein